MNVDTTTATAAADDADKRGSIATAERLGTLKPRRILGVDKARLGAPERALSHARAQRGLGSQRWRSRLSSAPPKNSLARCAPALSVRSVRSAFIRGHPRFAVVVAVVV